MSKYNHFLYLTNINKVVPEFEYLSKNFYGKHIPGKQAAHLGF